MRRLATLVLLLLLARAAASAANKDIISLQRDVALVDDRIRALQQRTDEKLLAMTALLEQTLQCLTEIKTNDAALLSSFVDSKHLQQRDIQELQSVGAKVDRMTEELRATRDTMAEFTARLKHVEGKLSELDNAVRVIQLPPPPPPNSELVLPGSSPRSTAIKTRPVTAAGDLSGEANRKHPN